MERETYNTRLKTNPEDIPVFINHEFKVTF